MVHHLAELFQRGTDRHIETAVQVDDQQEHHHQSRDQQHHVRAVFFQADLQLFIEECQHRMIELISLIHGTADIGIELRPGRIQRIGNYHLVFKHHRGGFQGFQAAGGLAGEFSASLRTAVK